MKQVWSDGENWVVAESASDALIIQARTMGYDDIAEYQHYTGDMPSHWKALDPEEPLTVTEEDEGPVTKLARTWAEETGEGYLAGTDY